MPAVAHTHDFDRVSALPRRVVTRAEACEWADALTPLFALRSDVALLPWQAYALKEAVACGGAWLALPVGQGKTLLSWLLPTALQAQRTLLVVPASLRDKTRADFAALRESWTAPAGVLRIESREKLAVESGYDLLSQYAPDLLVLDESDDLSNASSSAVRRIDRYVRDNAVRVVAMSGTPARKSLLGYWHLLAWCLGNGAPVPLQHSEARMWALAIDEYKGQHARPGPLGATLRDARAWFRTRLEQTPGVLVVDEDSCDAPLSVHVRIASDDAVLNAAFERLGREQENPGGIPVSDPLSLWRLDAQLGLGFYTVWDPAPPDEWRNARRAVARFVRERIDESTHSARPLDTEAQVLRRYREAPPVRAWLDVRDTFDGSTRTVWLTRRTLEDCAAWVRAQTRPAIVWCGSVEFARELASMTGLRYYGEQGRTDDGSPLHAAPPGASFIASWNANKKGFNLQAWTRQLVTMPPQSARYLEQLIGRSHRQGQSERVRVDVLATSGGTLDAFASAIAEARAVRDTVGLTQKALRAEITRDAPRITESNRFRWARRQRT